ncbi:NAD(P)-dependent oxidoreductase [bacterium]|nr:MAG: NAD(P)-dependent oxidoreductase [bacterium]
MSLAPILLLGGSGIVGRCTAHYLREAHPEVPLIIGGRNLANAQKVASEVGNAEAVALDMSATNLGLGDREVSAVAVLVMDDSVAGLRFAQSRGVPHLSISRGTSEIGPEVAAYIHSPNASAVVLATEWLVGATTIPALQVAQQFSRVDDITIGALLDEKDESGPAAASDMHRQSEVMPAALTRRDGAFLWRLGDESQAQLRAIDGTTIEAIAFSPYDVMALATATGAPNVQFNVAIDVTSTRRRGEPFSTEIIIEMAGEDHAGQPLRTRHAVFHPQGQMPLTALGVAMLLERLVGLDNKPAPLPGLYFPYQLLEPTAYFARLEKIGGKVIKLDVL